LASYSAEESGELIARTVVSLCFNQPRIYNLLLDHWGFTRGINQSTTEPETFLEMYTRLKTGIIEWWNSEYNGFHDNSIKGVKDLNAFADKPSDKTYYFTMSFDATRSIPRQNPSGHDIASIPVNPVLTVGGLLFPGPFNLAAHAISGAVHVAHELESLVPGNPDDIQYANWILGVVKSHAKSLGYNLPLPKVGARIPRADMLPLISFFSYGMSGLDSPAFGHDGRNDGIVNTGSMAGPDDTYIRPVANFPLNNVQDGQGTYWHLGTNFEMDHADEIGVFTAKDTVSWRGFISALRELG
jgi:hypothetical protein